MQKTNGNTLSKVCLSRKVGRSLLTKLYRRRRLHGGMGDQGTNCVINIVDPRRERDRWLSTGTYGSIEVPSCCRYAKVQLPSSSRSQVAVNAFMEVLYASYLLLTASVCLEKTLRGVSSTSLTNCYK